MQVLLSIVFIIIGVVGVVWGADKFTDGAASLAHRMKVPEIVIGLTIVAFGTSAPEFFVSLVSALHGSSGLALGNIVGSNIFNALLITGCAAIVAPLTVSKSVVKKNIPFAVGASLLLVLLSLDGTLSRIDGLILLVGLALFMYQTLRTDKKTTEDSTQGKDYTAIKCTLLIVLGLACLIVCSNLFVRGASTVARMLGVSEAVVGLTIVACGTSLPELATSVVSARKGQAALAIGNVIGSNVINILLILGVTGVVCPLSTACITPVDFTMLMVSILLLWLMSFTNYRVTRKEGFFLLILFIGYLLWIVFNAVLA